MPSMQAPDRPRRPIRRMQRTRRILPRQAAHHFPGAVGGIVVDEDDFPGDVPERRLQPPVQHRDVVALVEGGDDDRKLRQTGGLRRVFGARSDGVIHERQRIAAAAGDAKAPSTQGVNVTDRGKTGQNRAPKCQRPRTEGARTSGAAKLFMVVPAPELLKRQRRRYQLDRDAQARSARAPGRLSVTQANSALPGSPAPAEPAPRAPVGRLLDGGRLGRRLAELPDRPIGDRHHQHDRGDDGAQNTALPTREFIPDNPLAGPGN